jgi:YfiH family protein
MPSTLEPHTFAFLQKQPSIFHGLFSRHGGCSPPPFASLNVSFGVGDDPHNVEQNRQHIKDHFKIAPLISARQVHGKRVAVISTPQDSNEIDGVDALICSVPGTGILIQQADCQAILLYDPKQKIVAGIHSGWQGSVANIIGETIQTMTLTFGSKPIDLIAGVSPSLGPCCAEFIHYKTELPQEMYPFQTTPNHFDFWAISASQLQAAGVYKENIEINGTCSKCSDQFFSYRRNKTTGRFCSIIGLRHE